jgi:hypothetical protein
MKAWGLPLAITRAEMGRKGGPARAASLSPERRSEIARLASAARWAGPRTPPAEGKVAQSGGGDGSE